jgi:hypothetical protein
MTKLNYLLGFICLSFAFTSCDLYQPIAYNVTTPNVPLLESVGDVQAMGAVGANHLELHGAVSPFNHVSLMGNFYAGVGRQQSSCFGIGTYYRLNRRFLFELYALTGKAVNNDDYEAEFTPLFSSNNYRNEHVVRNNYLYNSLQLNVGFNWNERGTYFFSSRFTRTFKHHYDYTLHEYSDQGSSAWSLLETTENHFRGSLDVMDFSLGYAWRMGKLKCQYQVTAFVGIGELTPEERAMLYYRPLMGSLTLGWEFDNVKRRKIIPPTKRHNSSEKSGI